MSIARIRQKRKADIPLPGGVAAPAPLAFAGVVTSNGSIVSETLSPLPIGKGKGQGQGENTFFEAERRVRGVRLQNLLDNSRKNLYIDTNLN
jgi:hypothetical protein